MNNPLISVIIPVYNVEDYLGRCIESALKQSYPHLEIILVDDGAKDNSGKICDEYAEKDSRIVVIHKENGGLSSARNAGIEVAKGEYLAFLDSDDWIPPDAYECLLNSCLEHNVKLSCGGRYDAYAASEEQSVGLCPPCNEAITATEMLARIFTWDNCDSAACDKLFHRSLFEEIRFPLNQVSEDVAIMYQIIEKAGRVAMCNKPIYYYFHRPNSITTSAISEKSFHILTHTAKIYSYIKQQYPEIAKEALYFRLRTVIVLSEFLCSSDQKTLQKHICRYKELIKELRKNKSFLMNRRFFSLKECVHNILLITGLYRLAWKISRYFKRAPKD